MTQERVELSDALSALLDENERFLIADALNGLIMTECHQLPLEIQDALAIEEGLAVKWGVDGPALVAKLEALDEPALQEIVESVWFFWHGEPFPDDLS